RRRSSARTGRKAVADLSLGRMPTPSGLQYSHCFTFSKGTICPQGHREPLMKIEKADVKSAEFRVWCDCCSIRIAPNEEQIAVDGKTYHQRCYSKTFSAGSKAKTKSSQAVDIRGRER